MSIRQADRIRRKDHIPQDVRTQGKDDAAETIDELIAAGEWPMDVTDIADRAGWSRQHIANVLDSYYEVVESDTPEARDVTIHVPDDVDKMSYLRGWMDCFKEQ